MAFTFIFVTSQKTWFVYTDTLHAVAGIGAKIWLARSLVTLTWPCSVCCPWLQPTGAFQKLADYLAVHVLQDEDLELFSLVTGSFSVLMVVILVLLVMHLYFRTNKWVQCFFSDVWSSTFSGIYSNILMQENVQSKICRTRILPAARYY